MNDDELLESAIKKQNARTKLYEKLDDYQIKGIKEKIDKIIEAHELGLIDAHEKNRMKADLKERVRIARQYRYKIVFDGNIKEYYGLMKDLHLTKPEQKLYWEWIGTQNEAV